MKLTLKDTIVNKTECILQKNIVLVVLWLCVTVRVQLVIRLLIKHSLLL